MADDGSLVPISDEYKGEGKGLAKGLGRWFTVQERPHGPLERRWFPFGSGSGSDSEPESRSQGLELETIQEETEETYNDDVSSVLPPKLEGHPEVSEACLEESEPSEPEPKNMKDMLDQYSLAMNRDHPCHRQHQAGSEDEYAGDWSSADRAAGPDTPSWPPGSPPPSPPLSPSTQTGLHGPGQTAHDEVYEDNRSNEEAEEDEEETSPSPTSPLGRGSKGRKRKAPSAGSAVAESQSPAVVHDCVDQLTPRVPNRPMPVQLIVQLRFGHSQHR